MRLSNIKFKGEDPTDFPGLISILVVYKVISISTFVALLYATLKAWLKLEKLTFELPFCFFCQIKSIISTEFMHVCVRDRDRHREWREKQRKREIQKDTEAKLAWNWEVWVSSHSPVQVEQLQFYFKFSSDIVRTSEVTKSRFCSYSPSPTPSWELTERS